MNVTTESVKTITADDVAAWFAQQVRELMPLSAASPQYIAIDLSARSFAGYAESPAIGWRIYDGVTVVHEQPTFADAVAGIGSPKDGRKAAKIAELEAQIAILKGEKAEVAL